MKNKFLTKLLCFVISIMMIVPTGISFVAAEDAEDPFEALASYGGYADTQAETNMQIYSNENNAPADVYLYDMTIAEEKATVDAKALTDENTKTVLDANPGARYVCIGNNDSAWKSLMASDGETEKEVMFTTKYLRNRPSSAWVGGSVYFKATDIFTKDDTDVTFIAEYLDIGTANIGITYVNSDFDGSKVSVSGASLPRTNTGKWVTSVVSVTDANIAVGLNKTALGDQKQTIKVSCGDVDTYISRFMVVKTSDYEKFLAGELGGSQGGEVVPPSEPQEPGDQFEELASYGGYADTETETNIATYSNKNNAPADVYLYDMEIAEEKAKVEAFATTDANTKTVLDANPGARYVCIGNSDSAWRIVTKSDVEGIEKSAMFTNKYLRNRPASAWVSGMIHFKATDVFTKDDNELTFVVEYLDEGTADIKIEYVNTSFDGSAASLSSVTLPRTNTGKWVTNVVSVQDANIAAGLTNTKLADQKQTVRVWSSSIDTYISKFMVVKTSDYEKYLAGELGGGSQGGNQGGDQEEDENENQKPEIDGIDFDLLGAYGAYINADTDTKAVGTNIVATTNDTRALDLLPNNTYHNVLKDLSIKENMDAVNANAAAKANYDKYGPVAYSNIDGNTDGAWMYKEGTSNSGVTHNAMFTTKYVTARTGSWGWTMPGKIYFRTTGVFTKTDNNITFIIEYLDKGTANLDLIYVNDAFVEATSSSGEKVSCSNKSIARTDSGEWKQAVIQVTDANIAAGLKWTALADKMSQIYIGANSVDTYISKFLAVKTSDYEKYLAGELEETDDVIVANAKAALKLDIKETKENFTLPTVDGVTVTWKSDNSAIVIDGNTAVVTQGASDSVVKLTATISKGDASDTKVFEVKVPAKFGKASGVELIFADDPANDIQIGNIKYDGNNTVTKLDAPETTSGENLMYESSGTADFDSMRVLAGPDGDQRWAVYGMRFSQPSRNRICNSNVPIEITEFTKSDNKVTFEIDYLDNGTDAISFNYITGSEGDIPPMGNITINRTNTGKWMTKVVTVTNAYYDNNLVTKRGLSNKADIRIEGKDYYISRIEVYTSKAYKDILDAKNAFNIDNVADENGVSVAGGTVSTNFELPETVDGYDGSEVIWSSSNTDAIVFEGGKAKVFLSESGKQIVTITAAIVLDGCFVEKSFEVILAKKARTLYIADDAVVTGDKTASANVAFDIKNLEGSMGKEVALIVSSIDEATDEIIAIDVERKTVESSTMSIDATVDNSKGRLCYYLTMDNGAVIYNIAPGAIKNFKVSSTSMGINITWDEPEDDYIFIKEYVLYDGNGDVVDTIPGDETSYFVPLAKNETRSYCLEGFDHAGLSTGKTEVKSGSLFKASGLTVKLYDLEGDGSNPALFNDYIGNPDTDNHSHKKVMKDAVTGEELECRHTLNRSEGVCTCGKKCNRSGGTFLYFKPDKTYVTAKTQEVAVIVKYFDYGTGEIKAQYNKVGDADAGKQAGGSYSFTLTGTNTFKTHVIKIYDAEFTSPSTLSNADIRFSGGPNGEIYFAEVTIMPLENYAEMPTPEIYIAGDSIASVYPEGNSRIGWGMELPGFLTNDVSVINKAVAGSSTKTFPNMDAIIANADKTDYVLISFGHNDSMANDRGVTVDEYKTNMINFINKITDKKATPVIITSIPQINHSNGTLIYDKQNPDGIMPYRDAAIEVAKIMGVNYIDLAGIMAEQAKDMTKEQVLALYEEVVDPENADPSHISKAGAEWVAGIIANELKAEKFGFISSYVK